MTPDAPLETLDRGTYELLRERLRGHGRELSARVEKLNAARKATFGAVEPELVATERVSTEHNCVPRDMVAVGDTLLFGYNVHFGLKAERSPSDVLAAYTFSERRFHPRPLDLLADSVFEKDFRDVYKFYKDAAFEKFAHRGPLLYIQLRIGPSEGDVKAFKWATDREMLRYVDNRSDYEVRLPNQYEFEWRRTRREDHVAGKHPHVNLLDKVFVETIGGDLTIKIENNTDTGQGIYSEPVENADQSLDDAELRYADLGSLIALKVKPYQETVDRYLVYCEKTRKASRVDGISSCCRLLPADQGIIFPAGYLLHTGDGKTFDGVPAGTNFEARIDAPNGEDFLYVFYHRGEGLYVLIRYNVIAQAADPPLLCHGYTLFPGGELVCFRAQPEPQRHHAIQIWRTPFASEALPPDGDSSSELLKIGNREIVRGLSECREILTLLDKEDTFGDLYAEIARRAGDLLDSYYWIRHSGTFRLDEPLEQIRSAATATIDEYEKVARARTNARHRTETATKRVEEAVAAAKRQRFESVAEFTETLMSLRALRGEVIGLRDVRYTDAVALDGLEATLKADSERIAGRCVAFLDHPESLASFTATLESERCELGAIRTARDAKAADDRVAKVASDLELLVETVSNLPIEDATQRTRVVDAISTVFASVNGVRAEIRNRRTELARTEGASEFAAQLKLLSQAVVNALDRCDTPAKCDELLARLLVQVEELEGRFADFDEFAVVLAEKREEIASAFDTRKTLLLETRARRAGALAAAADRLLGGVASRSKSLEDTDAIHSYFAGDMTVGKIRDIAGQLADLGDAVRADGLLTRLKSLRDDAIRQFRDRQDLFAEGPGVVNLGGYRFGVNTQPFDLTTIVCENRLTLHLTGTRFYEAIDDGELIALRDLWSQEYVSETADVYRAEYLSWSLFNEQRRSGTQDDLSKLDETALAAWVADRMAPRYAEGYLKGVHDRDAVQILRALIESHRSLGPLRTPPKARALARLFWGHACPPRMKERLVQRQDGLRHLAAVWPDQLDISAFREELRDAICRRFGDGAGRYSAVDFDAAADFLASRLLEDGRMPVSSASVALVESFRQELSVRSVDSRFRQVLDAAGDGAVARFGIARTWLAAYVVDRNGADDSYIDEAAVLVLPNDAPAEPIAAEATYELSGLLGEHSRIEKGRYRFEYYDFHERIRGHVHDVVPRFQRFAQRKHQVLVESREELKLDGFRAQVMASFVRNRLIDTAYLPLIGANLAKQLGVAGEETRADRQGLLLLISPPGYGKTTLMEYVADRLGLVFLKINGPAIGHAVTSLDPESAPNLAAREELRKLGLGFEMGDNVMIYVDDVQHCHPEFLQKFISLCDAQRKVEGVWRGEAKTYDLRGRKVAIVMAGNPYTESGEMFKIPDMLANRADVYNLGDVSGGHRPAFELSFLENSLTSNASLTPLAGRPKDAIGVIGLAEGKDPSTIELEGNYDAADLEAMTAVMRKLVRVRDVVLKVNAEYIRSAAQADEFRTEPAFKLQGSYRNMNRIAEKVIPAMNDAELEDLIASSYRSEAQTLTTGAESNLLKLRELVGRLSPDEAARWNDIKQTFLRNQKLRGVDQSDRFGQAVAQLSLFADGLTDLRDALATGLDRLASRPASAPVAEPASDAVAERLEAIREGLTQLATVLNEGLSRPAGPGTAGGQSHQLVLDAETIRAITNSFQGTRPTVRVIDGNGDVAEPPASSITIVNKIPPTLVAVLQEQFRLMEEWLKPVLLVSQRHSDEVAGLARRIETCLAEYERLVGRIEAGRDETPVRGDAD